MLQAGVMYHQVEDVNAAVRAVTKDFMFRSAVKLMELGSVKETRQGTKHVGGIPVYTGMLRSSWQIFSYDSESCVVGSNLEYAVRLIKGLPDPYTKLQDIKDWVRLRQGGVDTNPYGV